MNGDGIVLQEEGTVCAEVLKGDPAVCLLVHGTRGTAIGKHGCLCRGLQQHMGLHPKAVLCSKAKASGIPLEHRGTAGVLWRCAVLVFGSGSKDATGVIHEVATFSCRSSLISGLVLLQGIS